MDPTGTVPETSGSFSLAGEAGEVVVTVGAASLTVTLPEPRAVESVLLAVIPPTLMCCSVCKPVVAAVASCGILMTVRSNSI